MSDENKKLGTCPACGSTVCNIRFDIKLHSTVMAEHWMHCFHPWHVEQPAQGEPSSTTSDCALAHSSYATSFVRPVGGMSAEQFWGEWRKTHNFPDYPAQLLPKDACGFAEAN